MPPSKISTGYLTPQTKRPKPPLKRAQSTKTVPSVPSTSSETNSQFDEVFEKLMQSPEKRKMVLQFLNEHKDVINQYKKDEARKQNSPLANVKKKVAYSSPTALHRKRALELMEKDSAMASDAQSERSESRQSEASRCLSRQSETSSSRSTPTVPFDKIMQGVVAYVEIKSKGQDKSEGAKTILKSMGATIREQFTKDVTHVVFKDGSFKTFQKAKLMKIPMVSILWVEFSRKAQCRQKESNYPPLSSENNISTVCSQMHKEYEDIIREEYRRSITNGTPLPSTQSLRDRRRTLMSTSYSSNSLHSTFSKLPDGLSDSQLSADEEVEQITKHKLSRNLLSTPNSDEVVILNSPEIGEPDEISDTGATVNAQILNEQSKKNIFASVMKSIEHIKDISSSDMDFTCADGSLSLITETSEKRRVHLKTPKSKNTPVPKVTSNKPTILSNILLPNISSDISTDKSCNINEVTPKRVINFENVTSRKKKIVREKSPEMSKIPSLHLLSNKDSTSALQILSQNAVETAISSVKEPDKNKSASTASMSSLRISDSNSLSKAISSVKDSYNKSASTGNMSSLRVSDSNSLSKAISSVKDADTANISSVRVPDSKTLSKDSVKELENKSLSTGNMSSLRVSDSNTHSKNIDSMSSLKLSVANLSASTHDMSPLRVSDPKVCTKSPSSDQTSKSKKSFESEEIPLIDKNCIEEILESINSPRISASLRRSVSKVSRDSSNSNNFTEDEDSEIISSGKKSNRRSNTRTQPDNKIRRVSPRKNSNICNSPTKIDNKAGKVKILTKNKETDRVSKRSLDLFEKNSLTEDEVEHLSSKDILKEKNKTSKKIGEVHKHKEPNEKCLTVQLCRIEENLAKLPSEPYVESIFNGREVTDNTSSSDNVSDKKRKKMRRLYDPNDFVEHLEDSDEKERNEKRKKALKSNKRKSVVLVPLFPNNSDAEKISNNDTDELELEFLELPTTSKRQKKTKRQKKVDYNSSQDEQRDLFNEIISKKKANTKTSSKFKTPSQLPVKRSARLTSQTKENKNNTKRTNSSDSDLPITPINRRSTLDFESLSFIKSTAKKAKVKKTKIPTIVCTKLHKPDVQLFTQIVKKLGGFTVENEVSKRTTHLVAGEPKRTINMLRAVARGCWVVKFEWVLNSLEAGRWLPEEDFEDTQFSVAVQQTRIERHAFGPRFTMDVFEDCGPIFIARSTTPRCSDLQELVTLCKGKVVTCQRMARLVIGEYVDEEEVICLTETWVLDCITLNKKVGFKKKYLIEKPTVSRRSLVV